MTASAIRPATLAVLIVFMTLPGFSPAHGQTGDTLIDCRSLESVRSSIDQLTAALLEQSAAQARRDEVQLAIAYLQYRSRRIESLEQELRRLFEPLLHIGELRTVTVPGKQHAHTAIKALMTRKA